MAGWSIPGVVHPREVREDVIGRRVVARHRMTRRSLAITYLSSELLADAEFRTRFAREFPRLAQVRDTRVARVHRYVECDHSAAVIGDHVRGSALRSLLLAHGAVGIEVALVVLKDSLLALAACHEAGLAHGDVRPEHVVVTSTGRVRLVDFGLWTSTGRRLLGRATPFYLAPEQWSERSATSAGDVYAATVTFFECLVGAPPFYADSVAELSIKHELVAAPVDVVPEPVRQLVLRGLAKDLVSRADAPALLGHIHDVADRAVGSGWERRGRRELATLLGSRRTLPDVSAIGRRSDRAGWKHHKPVRMAAVMGGALALAAGLSSPPLAVILPGISVFGPGRSPVLAFPEPDQSTVPVRVVTHGPLADRALSAKAVTGTQVAKARPSAASIPTPNSYPVPYRHPIAGAVVDGSADSDGVDQRPSTSSQFGRGESTFSSPACAQGELDQASCSSVNRNQPAANPAGTGLVPSQVVPAAVSTPVDLPIQLPVQLPVPVVVPVKAPVQAPKSVPAQKRIVQSPQDAQAPKDAQIKTDYGSWKEASGPSTSGKTGYSTNRSQERSERSADFKFSGHGNSSSSLSGISQSTGQGNRDR